MSGAARALLAVGFAVLSLSGRAIAQPLTDHLLVYAIAAGSHVPVTYRMDLAAVDAELGAFGCRLKAGTRPRQLLVPVEKRDVTPVPPAPDIRGNALEREYLCYKVKCDGSSPTGPIAFDTQFLAQQIGKLRVRSLCVPVATPGQSTSTSTVPGSTTTTATMPTCAGLDESCAAGQKCCEGLTCCAGVPVPPGQEFCGQICPISDRNKKESFESVDKSEVLRKLDDLRITTWRYKSDPAGARHLGPVAQDFKAAFGLGARDDSIFLVDADGVALTAIQALSDELAFVKRENTELRHSIDALEKRLDAIGDGQAPQGR
jgi:hypothetical protein